MIRFFKRILVCPVFYSFKILETIGLTVSCVRWVLFDDLEETEFDVWIIETINNIMRVCIDWAKK